MIELELEHRLTTILAELVCSDTESDDVSASTSERLFVEVYRTVCAMRGGHAIAFVRVPPN